jgi:integrase
MPKYIGVYKAPNGTWYFKTRVDGRQVTRRGFVSAAEASEARRELIDEAAKAPRRAAGSPVSVGEFLDQWLDEAQKMNRVGPKTAYDYRFYIDSYIKPVLGDVVVDKLTVEQVKQWQIKLADDGGKRGRGLSANTIRLARAPLNRACGEAVRQGVLHLNPVSVVSPPRKSKKKPAFWTADQARTFLSLHEGDRLWPVWVFMLGAGVRIGELVWLTWPNVDFARRVVHISDFATTLGYKLVPSDGKSPDATRPIEVDTQVLAVLRAHQENQRAERAATAGYQVNDYVFTKPDGDHYHPQYLSKKLGRLSTELELPRLTAHGLRHTSATLMVSGGIHPKVAAERLGHADASLFLKLYGHVAPSMQRDAADRLGGILFDPDDSSTDTEPDKPAEHGEQTTE